MTTTRNANQTPTNAAFVVNTSNGEVKVIVTNKQEEKTANPAKPVSGFAKNTRYSIYNNGSGYTGL